MSERTPLVASRCASSRLVISSSLKEYNDEASDVTVARKVARYLSKFCWYCPQQLSRERAQLLDKAWAFFEHSTLARYHTQEDADDDEDHFVKAEPGERKQPTKLYPILSTPETDLADFGIGVGVYFYTLRMLSFIMLLAGILNIPNLWYYGGDDYNSGSESDHHQALKYSAVCTDQSWRPCPNCTLSQWDYFPSTFSRYAEAIISTTGQKVTFIRINNCYISKSAGVVAYVAMLFVCFAMYLLAKVSKWKENDFDLKQQTSSDYAVEVVNPPGDAKDETEWHVFFSQFGHVTSLTIAYDNEELRMVLLQRCSLVAKLEQLQSRDIVVDPQNIEKAVATALPVPWYQKVLGSLDAETIQQRIAAMDALIKNDLSERQYDVSEVFVVYETEEAQQAALQALQLPGLKVARNDTSGVDENLIFRAKQLLYCVEPQEPDTIRWQDLDETLTQQLKQQILTFFLTAFAILCGCAVHVYCRKKYAAVYAALTVTAVNTMAPYVCYYIVFYFESHASEGGWQTSLYFKITANRWITTALLTAMITPFTDTLENQVDSLIPAMYAIFITEMLKAPATQLLDISGHWKRHVLAPRARDQKRMCYYFKGTEYALSERYTDQTTVLFLTFYYAMLFPAGFFFGSATLCVHYWTDKFCLLRVWKQAPPIGSDIAATGRTYFYSSALIVYALMSSYSFASFPYDNACRGSSIVSPDCVGNHNATTGDGKQVVIDVSVDEKTYYYCNQDMARYHPLAFPAIPSNPPDGGEWMTPEQDFARVFGLTSVVVIALVVLVVMNNLRKKLSVWFVSPYTLTLALLKPHFEKKKSINFSTAPMKSAFVPQATIAEDPFPILLCDISKIDAELMSWEDHEHSDYRVHNAIYDIRGLAEKDVFGTIHHWPPAK